jgi:Trypsin-like peptidase domain/von Willebrand factor type A domain
MSHVTGTVQVLAAPLTIGPGTTVFNPPAAPGGTKLLVLHFQNLNFRTGDRLEVKLGYAVDTFTAADGPSFWTRPVNVYLFPGGVEITYVAAGSTTGSVQLDQYGRGERHAAVPDPGHSGFSNCDPFFQTPSYVEPTYDPFWYCSEPPNWENVAHVTPAADVRARVARSVGMILSVDTQAGIRGLSTCSVTLVDTDKVLTAGHCHTPEEALDSSITFDYQTDGDGNRPGGYNPRFYKVKAVLGHKSINSSMDYSLLQLAEAPVGIPTIQMRPDLPVGPSGSTPGEQVFGIHHPNGAVKKLSIPQAQGFARVTGSSSSGITVPNNFDVSGGSSGSGLFDTAGRIVGVCSRGAPCSGGALAYCPTKNIIADLIPTPPPPLTRDVMLVFDRSGSMSLDDGTGRKKIEAARDAVSLFVQLIKAGTGNRAGLVSFSTSASSPVDFALTNVTAGAKSTLVGPPPFSAGKVGALAPGGLTTIGGGLEAARLQFPAAGANPRAILLLTDGLQNTPPMVAAVEAALSGIAVHAIGFGTESSLDGALLTSLATSHGGMYMRAGGALALEKFFSNAFGNIFEAGILFDPEFDLPANQPGAPIPFNVCGEETITAVTGWDRTDAQLLLEVTSPGGAVITATTAGLETAAGKTWTFLRIPLPFGGERNGKWSVRVVRAGGGGEFPPPTPALRYFINVIPSGGPRMMRLPDTKRYYTGDPINPMVLVRHDNGGWPDDMKATMTITRPDTGVGNVLSQAGLGSPGTLDGDAIPARQATLQAIEGSTGKPVARYTETIFNLSDDTSNTDGLFEKSATFGNALSDQLTVEGNYTFHAKATYGDDCSGMRELAWSIHVDIGIDSGKTTVTTSTLDPRPDGGSCVRMIFTPRDKYNNLLGPGRSDSFTVEPRPGSTPSGPVIDLGNGSYQVDVCSDPDSLEPPGIVIGQPERPPVVIGSRDFKLFLYSVKFLCGEQKDDCGGCSPVQPGRYSTEINILNPEDKIAPVLKRVIALVLAGAVSGREPNFKQPATTEIIRLPAHNATMDDCCRLLELLLGARPTASVPLTLGILEIISTVELNVTAVYTASDRSGGRPSIDVKQVEAKVITR